MFVYTRHNRIILFRVHVNSATGHKCFLMWTNIFENAFLSRGTALWECSVLSPHCGLTAKKVGSSSLRAVQRKFTSKHPFMAVVLGNIEPSVDGVIIKARVQLCFKLISTDVTHHKDAWSEKTTSQFPSPCIIVSFPPAKPFWFPLRASRLCPWVSLCLSLWATVWFNPLTVFSVHRSQWNLPYWHAIKAYCSMKAWTSVTLPGKEQ